MSEQLMKNEPKTTNIMFKVGAEKAEEIKQFCRDRDWKLSAFIRVAIEESMSKVKTTEASGD